MTDYRPIQQRFLLGTYAHRGITLTHGHDMYLVGDDGTEYLDMMSSYGVAILGYSNTAVREAIRVQSERLLILHGSFANDARAVASRALVLRCGREYHQVYWSNSGAEAIEAALKFAVLATGKKRFVSMQRGYHGKTLGALSVTDGRNYRGHFEPLLWDIARIPFADTEDLDTRLTPDTAAIILEPVQGEGGILPADPEYLHRIRELCTERNILLIADEIQCGTGRTGTFLALERSRVSADIVCLGKGLAGGLPVGATVVSRAVAERIPKLVHSSTFGGNPLICAAVSAVLQELTPGLLARVQENGAYYVTQLRALHHPGITQVRGAGLMIGVDVSGDRNAVLKKLQQRGILAIPAGEDTVRFLPPYIVERSHIDRVVAEPAAVLDTNSHTT